MHRLLPHMGEICRFIIAMTGSDWRNKRVSVNVGDKSLRLIFISNSMGFPALFRRRNLMLPTLLGWLLILSLLLTLGLMVFRGMAGFLIVNEPVNADYLVIEGWIGKDELDSAQRYFSTGDYRMVLVVGGPITNDFHGIDQNYADRAVTYLRQQGFDSERILSLPVPDSARNRTYLNALRVRDWFDAMDIQPGGVNVFSSDLHTRRSRDLYRIAFGDFASVGIIAAGVEDIDPDRWWKNSASGKYVVTEFAGWLLMECCFDPDPLESHL